MPDEERLLQLVAAEPGLSTARACKRLGVSRSELLRLLAGLGEDRAVGGVGLVRVEARDGKELLFLTERAVGLMTG